ncbi:hypothetical protein ACOTY1_24220, partial [Enterobacter cloacae complex sp. IR5462]
AENTDDLFVGKTLLHGDVLMWLMKTLLTSGCTNQRGAGHISIELTFTEVRAAYAKSKGSYFFTFTGKVRNDGIALTADKQDHILLGERYHLTGKVRKFYDFDSKNYAAITVFKLSKLQDS